MRVWQAMRDAARWGLAWGWRRGSEALSLACSLLSRLLGWPGAVQVSGWGVVGVCLGAVSTRGGGGAPPTAY